ncbi:MAG: diguanylate cyclase [Chitinivibrionia bacterium]|nr:diguanylate cyclase [Chitinivibrionia bacterium]
MPKTAKKTDIIDAKPKTGVGIWISLKLLFTSFVIMLGLSVAVSAVFIFLFRPVSQKTVEMYLAEKSAQISYQIKLVFEKALDDTRLNARNLSIIHRDISRGRVIEMMVDWLRNKQEYKAVFVNFAPGMFDNQDAHFARDTRFVNGIFATHISQASDGIRVAADTRDFMTSDKFRIPFETQRSYISAPTQVQIAQGRGDYYLLMRISSPIIFNGFSIGAVGVDYAMDDILSLISGLSVLDNPRGFVSLALSDGFIIASRDPSLIYRNISEFVPMFDRPRFEENLSRSEANFAMATNFPSEDKLFGRHMLSAFHKFSINDTEKSFIVMASIPEDDVFAAINEATKYAAAAAGFLMFLGLFILFVLIRLTVIAPIISQMKTIEKLSITDALTGLANRRHFENTFSREWKLAIRNKKPIAFLMLDADKFKTYNDTYGHPQGDKLLIALSTVLKRALHRPSDLPGRLGGEEFGVLLPNTDLAGAVHLGELIRAEVEKLRVKVPETGKITTTTVSIGAASMLPVMGDSFEKIMKIADEHLYTAKETGRNRVYSDLSKENA